MKKISVKRVLMSLMGVMVCGFSVGIFKLAAMGVDPFQSFMAGLNQLIPISFGLLYIIANVILLVFAIVCNRKCIGIATFINMFLVGYVTEFSYGLLQKLIVNPGIAVRILCLVIAVVIMCFGSAFYMTADLGVSTYDAVAITIAYKWKKGRFKYDRIITDVICVILGILLHLLGGGALGGIPAFVGAGTIVTAFFMGPLIDFFNERCAKPFLGRQDVNTGA